MNRYDNILLKGSFGAGIKGDNASRALPNANMELQSWWYARTDTHTVGRGRCARRKIAYKHEILEPPFYNTVVKTLHTT